MLQAIQNKFKVTNAALLIEMSSYYFLVTKIVLLFIAIFCCVLYTTHIQHEANENHDF